MPIEFDDQCFYRSEFNTNQNLPEEVPAEIVKSWRRCWPRMHLAQAAFLKTAAVSPPPPNQNGLTLLEIARPLLEDVFPWLVKEDLALVLTSKSGNILKIQGSEILIAELQALGIACGSDLSEYEAGTNAFALAMIENAPMQVRGQEHFFRKYDSLCDAATPIFDGNHHLVGTVGLITKIENYSSHCIALVVSFGQTISLLFASQQSQIEQQRQIELYRSIIQSEKNGIIAWDKTGQICLSNAAVETLFGVPSHLLQDQPISNNITFFPSTKKKINEGFELQDVATTVLVGKQPVHCLLTVRNLPDNLGSVALFKKPKYIQELVTRQVATHGDFGLQDLLGVSTQVEQLRSQIRNAARARASVLIIGEPNTGKSLLAQIIHSLSPAKDGPFIIFPCASIPSELIISALLGSQSYETDSTSEFRPSKFELADRGTLYLQDVDLLPLEAQSILLRMLKTDMIQFPGGRRQVEVSVRVISTTAQSLERLSSAGTFNPELLFWLRSFQLELPPLRERAVDIPVLVENILNRVSKRNGYLIQIAPEALDRLCRYDWPGNIRELELVLERAASYLLKGDPRINISHLPPLLQKGQGQSDAAGTPAADAMLLDRVQEETLLRVARECKGNVSEMARTLGIGRTTVWRWMRRIKLSPESFRNGA